MRDRERMLRVVDGIGSLPSKGAWMGGFVVGAFGLVWTALALKIGAPFPFALFGVLFAYLAVRTSVKARNRVQNFGQLRESYSRRRRELLDQDD